MSSDWGGWRVLRSSGGSGKGRGKTMTEGRREDGYQHCGKGPNVADSQGNGVGMEEDAAGGGRMRRSCWRMRDGGRAVWTYLTTTEKLAGPLLFKVHWATGGEQRLLVAKAKPNCWEGSTRWWWTMIIRASRRLLSGSCPREIDYTPLLSGSGPATLPTIQSIFCQKNEILQPVTPSTLQQ